MALPATVYNHYLYLNQKITWSRKEIGAVKGILSYYYGLDWVSVGEIYIAMVISLPYIYLDQQGNIFWPNDLDLIDQFFFNLGAFSKRWFFTQEMEIKYKSYYINLLIQLLHDGVFKTGLQMTPIIGLLSNGVRLQLVYFLSYSHQAEIFSVLCLEDNNTLYHREISKSDLEFLEDLDFLIVELPIPALDFKYLLYRGMFYSNMQFQRLKNLHRLKNIEPGFYKDFRNRQRWWRKEYQNYL
jgi:hypothetical protein